MDRSPATGRRTAVVMTVRNDSEGCAATLRSLMRQTRMADEIVIVDGGSTDQTIETIREFAAACERIRWISAAGANIAAGRNIAIAATSCELIATIDAGCDAAPAWLSELVAPFEADSSVRAVGGFYQIAPKSLLEAVVGLATMRGQLDPVDPTTFNPSARSMAFTKEAWAQAGGFPEWLSFSEDTLFDHKLRGISAAPVFAPKALVHWRPRTSLRSVARQFYNYGTGRGHTQIGAADFAYNLRNAAIVAALATWSLSYSPAAVGLAAALAYFYLWTFHGKATRIARRLGRVSAYPLSMAVMWIVLGANTCGYVVGSLQRIAAPPRYAARLRDYLEPAPFERRTAT